MVHIADWARTAPGRDPRDLVLAISPFERPDPGLVLGVLRAGSLGILDLGHDHRRGREALAEVLNAAPRPFGVRIPRRCANQPEELPDAVDTVVLADGSAGFAPWCARGRRVLVEVRTLGEALQAAAGGASGVIARGSEGGGRVGEETAFVLLQRLVGALDLPVWVAGGIGVHSAAAAVAGGAAGVVLDSQLALTRESSVPPAVAAAIRAMDGSETAVVAGYRFFVRPDLPAAALAAGAGGDAIADRLGADNLQEQLLPVGQEGAFAAPLAARWPTAGALVHAMRREIARHISTARRLDPLGPGSPFARSHGLRYPIAQGPMTRVSDRAEFAAAVAAAGGLPFLALSLMTGPECRALLEDTATRLAGRPFGAGILGFVPAEVRQAQLEVIHEVRPPVLLIAGGRPSQARPLEEAGIATYLHVPSPGLLQRFIREGARRFVFEGRECGGHVGPRSSFALWEAQVEAILAAGVASEVSVLFAGGVHDARSAAMVAALSAPLAEEGGQVGVLMGTAYLFTEEAVAAGAIVPGFQREAIACEGTTLLETAPGHATRCASTDFVRFFESERERLRAGGADPQAMWANLEVLNLGRLRMASKGVARDGEEMVRLSETDQRREGMFMLGQVAALRNSTTTVAELHEDVSAGGSALLPSLEEVTETMTTGEGRGATEIAIVGMACVFPGAKDVAGFWANVVAGDDAITEVPIERWDPALYYDSGAFTVGAGRKTPSKWGGFLPEIPFDALRYGIPPRSLAAIEPVQLLSLEVAAQALADAGYADGSPRDLDRSRVSVVFGAEAGTDLASAYGFRALAPQYLGGLAEQLDGVLPELSEDSFPGLLTNVIAGRIANRLDLGGVNYTVDAACASSLAAVDVAMKELSAGTSDMVLCGGADLHNGINDYLLFAAVHALSPKGRCASFDASADGIALGEGVACVVLKRLADARRDGDRVYAVIRSVAGSSDGRSLGLTAPRPEGQRRALERAYSQAGTSPAEVGLIEAHGTGTVVGDRTELAVLTELFDDSGAAAGQCVLGSVKSQIGHTKCAAGLAGLIKVARAVYHGVLPPTINLEDPNPGYNAGSSPFVFNTAARPWVADERVAGVSAFGFGGTNFHAVVASAGEVHPTEHGLEQWPAELFLFRGETVAEVRALVETVAGRLTDGTALRDLAAAAAAAGSGPVRLAVVARDTADLGAKLSAALASLAAETGTGAPAQAGVLFHDSSLAAFGAPPEVGFLFPGQGSQRPGMLSELFVAFPALRHHLARGARWAGTMLPPGAFGSEARQLQTGAVTDTRVAQPALGMADLAAAELLAAAGVTPSVAGGHSYGELAALAAAGVLAADDLLELSAARADAILAAAGDDPGAMAAASAPAGEVAGVLGSGSEVVIANDNAPNQVVISGPTDAVAAAIDRLSGAGLTARRINVACAFHSPVVAAASTSFAEHLAAVPVGAGRFPVWSNTTAQPYPTEPEAVRATLARQISEPVRFREQVLAMYDAGARVFVEVGPGNVLTGLVGRILAGRDHRAIPLAATGAGASDLEAFLLALAELAVLGVPVDTRVLFDGRTSAADLRAPSPARPGWTVNGQLVRTADGEIVPGALRPASGRGAVSNPVAVGAPPALAAQALQSAPYQGTAYQGNGHALAAPPAAFSPLPVADDARGAAVLEYLRAMREAVAAGREVMLAYLGAAASGAVAPGSLLGPGAVADNGLSGRYGQAHAATSANGQGHIDGNGHGLAHANGNGHSPAAQPSPAATDATRSRALTPAELLEIVLAAVAERTGYPVEMLDPKLDLEADLSIDSIKRLEIVAELAERAGLESDSGELNDDVMEELVALKTLEAIVAWLTDACAAGSRGDGDREAGGQDPGEWVEPARDWIADRHESAPATAETNELAGELVEVPPASLRFVPRLVELEAPDCVPGVLAGRRVVVTDDGGGIAPALAAILDAEGAEARVVRPAAALGESDLFVHLAALADGPANRALTLFERAKEAMRGGATSVVAISATGGRLGRVMADDGTEDPRPSTPGQQVEVDAASSVSAAAEGALRFAGMRGIVKTIAREISGVSARLVDLEPELDPREAAALIAEELLAYEAPVEVGRTRDTRSTTSVVEEGRPAAADPAATREVGPESVVLVTGGARGITSRVAVAMARRWRCHLVLVGRTPEPEGDEPLLTAAARTAPELRRVLARAQAGSPAEIEAEVRRILAARDVRSTLVSVRAAGATAEYHCADIRDPDAARAVVEAVYRDHGRLDGVVHGAGVLEDARLLDKDPASFARVFGTKVGGALGIADGLGPDVRFVVLFASVSGIFGNRGQVDYSAANDALADLARWLDSRIGARVVAVDWGPWAGGGMVSPELEREFARRGVGLLDPEDALERLFDEIASGAREPEVVVMRARPERFGWQPLDSPGSPTRIEDVELPRGERAPASFVRVVDG